MENLEYVSEAKLRSQLAAKFLCERYKQLSGEADTVETIIQVALAMPLHIAVQKCISES